MPFTYLKIAILDRSRNSRLLTKFIQIVSEKVTTTLFFKSWHYFSTRDCNRYPACLLWDTQCQLTSFLNSLKIIMLILWHDKNHGKIGRDNKYSRYINVLNVTNKEANSKLWFWLYQSYKINTQVIKNLYINSLV